MASVAVIEDGHVLFSDRREAPMQASQALLEMLPSDTYDLVVADCGPGSFIGVRVAVALAKALAWSAGIRCAAVTAFDLISAEGIVAFPSRRGEYFIRSGSSVTIATSLPEGAIGHGPDFAEPTFPDAARAAQLWDSLEPVSPEALLPNYLLEPSISTPKVPYAT